MESLLDAMRDISEYLIESVADESDKGGMVRVLVK